MTDQLYQKIKIQINKKINSKQWYFVWIRIGKSLQLHCATVIIGEMNVSNLASVANRFITDQRPHSTEYSDISLATNNLW